MGRAGLIATTLCFVFLITFLASPTMGAGWFWDTGNAIGFATYGGLIYLMLTSVVRLDVRAHQVLGYGVLATAIAHAFWFLLGDAAAAEFLKPGAPDYMWLGLVSLLALGILMTVAIIPDRLRVHRNYASFKYWHQIVAVTTIAAATYHVVVSHFYLNTWYQGALFVTAALIATFGGRFSTRLGRLKIASNVGYLSVSIVVGGVFVLIRNIPW